MDYEDRTNEVESGGFLSRRSEWDAEVDRTDHSEVTLNLVDVMKVVCV